MKVTGIKNILLWLVAIGFFMETLDSTIVNTAIPAIARSLGESPLNLQSIIIAYALTLAVLIPSSGWLADRFGTKKVYFSAILIFTLGSLLCALSHNLDQLIISRVIQGAGGSMLLPVGRLAVLRAFPGAAFIGAISFVTVPALIGPLLGPSLGGWLVQFSSWHWIFLINIPIGIIGCIATFYAMPEAETYVANRFDFSGFLLICITMLSLSFSLDGLSGLKMSHAVVLLLFFLGFASLTAYVLSAKRKPTPLFSLSLFDIETYNIGILGNLFARVGCGSMPFLIPLFLQLCLGHSPFAAGLAMLPIAIAGILAKKIVPPIIIRNGYRRFMVINTLVVGACMASFALITNNEPDWLRITQLFIFGIVNSMQFTAMNTLTLKDLNKVQASSGNTLFSMIQMLAMSFGVAASGALLATFTARYDLHNNPDEILKAFHMTFLCVGGITCTSAWIFWQLQPDSDQGSNRKLTVTT